MAALGVLGGIIRNLEESKRTGSLTGRYASHLPRARAPSKKANYIHSGVPYKKRVPNFSKMTNRELDKWYARHGLGDLEFDEEYEPLYPEMKGGAKRRTRHKKYRRRQTYKRRH